MYSITFQQIEAFLTIAKHMNLSKAADALYISQPAISKTLQRFEEGVGMRLFLRSNQGVFLTPEGEQLRAKLEPLYHRLNQAIDEVRADSDAPPKTLRIVEPTIYDLSENYIEAKGLIRHFEELHPEIQVVESLCDFREMRQSLEFAKTDVAILQDFVLDEMENIHYKRISEFRMFVAMSVEHPLAKSATLPIDALSGEVFYRVPYLNEERSREIYAEECREIGFMPKRFEFVENVQTLMHVFREKRGIGIVGRFTHFGEDDIRYYPIPELSRPKYIVAAWRSDRLTPEAKLFVRLLPGEELLMDKTQSTI
ncbi:MAG: LysR family transcriptional regulator [Clostridiales Family XIII bacterium]|jgi:DNA-binding transcriptional LysR family regulator|nr:LysR family transcriptional regulator [Clostridiales Family XIII bacterium]